MNIPLRLRRLRRTPSMRALFAETQVSVRNLVMPYFLVPGTGVRQETRPGLGLWQVSADVFREEVSMLARAGVGGVMLFGVPEFKRDDGLELEKQLAPVQRALGEAKAAAPELPLFADVCLCAYTTHGHCGLVKGDQIVNDESVAVLARMAVLFARWGVDFVCPSDKMASAFYGPFREAAHSAPSFGDRRSYQMPHHNRREARRELLEDLAEGADALLIKPAMSNLDLIRDAREACDAPLFAYQVSGEYAMMRAAGDAGLIDFDRAVEESLVSIRRAGADVVVSYAARDWARR
jgi:porphobilinogen synthase